jgi:hypothetical protein
MSLSQCGNMFCAKNLIAPTCSIDLDTQPTRQQWQLGDARGIRRASTCLSSSPPLSLKEKLSNTGP